MQPSNNGSEHELKIKQLGSIKLSVAFQSDDAQDSDGSNLTQDVTVFSFLRKMLKDSEKIFNVRNKLTDENIKNIVKYIANLEASDITDQDYKEGDKIYHFLPTSLDEKRIVSEKRALELKKENLILELILCGINPLRIKECLQSKNNENEFNGLSWNKICKDAVCFKKEIEDAQTQYEQLKRECPLYDKSKFDVPLLFLNYMYLIEICKNPSGNEQTLTLCYKNISNSKYISSVYDGYMIPFFLIKYLHCATNNQNDNEQATRLLEINRRFVECLLNDKIGGCNSPHIAKKELQKELQKQSGKDRDLEPILDIDIYKFDGYYKFLIPKFWDIIDNLPEECIFVFVAEMMREVTLTREQLNVVNEKITNMSLHSYLKKLNYDPNHKKDQESIINKGTKIFWANYLCEKLFRVIATIPSLVLIGVIVALHVLGAYMFICASLWFFFACTVSSGAVVVKFWCWDEIIKKFLPRCTDFMQQAYDKTIGSLMKVWALHYPVNNIPPRNTAIQITSMQGNYYSTSENFRQNNIAETGNSSMPIQNGNNPNTLNKN